MAVYKASNCTPFLGSIDLTFGQIAQCEINSSNSTVTGYRLEILDNLNNVIFSGERFSPVPQKFKVDCIDANATYYTNTGLNGSMLTIPLIIRGRDKVDIVSKAVKVDQDIRTAINATATGDDAGNRSDLSLAQCANIIYYDTEDKKWYKVDVSDSETGGLHTYSWVANTEIPNLSNGYVNMPYKWRITLAQGQKTDTAAGAFDQQPTDSKWYDMGIAVNQQVLGSTVNRIQGPYSDKILSDYFIQLGTYNTSEGFKSKGQRVIITSYDNYGYIYPRENYITEDILNQSTHFQIYKETNEAKYVNSNRKVGYLSLLKIDRDLSGVGMTIDPENGRFHYNLASGYYEQIYNNASSDKVNSFNPTVQMYTGQQIGGSLIGGGTAILFAGYDVNKAQGTNSWTNNPFNGIFVFADKVFDSNNNQMILRWQRPAMADSWAEYLDQIFYIENGTEIEITKSDGTTEKKSFGGQNIQCMADDMGVLNSSPLEFKEEEPIEIYSTDDLDNDNYAIGRITTTVGAIAKNTDEDIYIRANNAVEAGQQFRYATSTENNYSYDTQIIKYVNRDLWYINPQEGLDSALTPGTQYSIYSYFKGSDENPFYAYTTPEIELQIQNVADDGNNGNSISSAYTLASYILNATGTFSQEQNRTWRSFQWILTNRTLNYSITGEKQYSGVIEYNFSGLQDLMEYSLQLIMEDEWGNVLGVTKYFKIDLGAEAYDYFPVTLTFDCDTQSVDIQFIRTGYIMPDPFSETDLALNTPSYQGLSYPRLSEEASDYYLSIANSQTWYDQYRANLRLGEDGIPVTERDIKGTALYIPLSGTDLIDSGEQLTGYIEVTVVDDDSETGTQASTTENIGTTTTTGGDKNTATKIVSLYANPPTTPTETEEWMRWNASSDAPTVGGDWTLYYKDDSGEFKSYTPLSNSPAIAVNGVKNYRDYGVLYHEIEVIEKRTNGDVGAIEESKHIPLSGPTKDDFTLNLEVWQLSKLYEGNILVSYVYFNANQFEDAIRRLVVELSVPDVYIQANEGTTVDAENLYKIWVRCWYENKSSSGEWVIDDEEDQASSEVKFYGQDLNDSSTWLPSNKIPVLLFGKLDADTQLDADNLAGKLHQNADFYMADIVANVGTGDKQTHIINAIKYIDNEQNPRPDSAPYYNLMGDVNCHTPVSESPEGITQGYDENQNAVSDIVSAEWDSEGTAPFYGVIRFPLRERMDQVTGAVATSTGQERSNNYLKTPFFVKSKTTTGEYAPMYVSTNSIVANALAEGEVVEPTEENENAVNNKSPKVALYVRDYSGMRNVWTDYLCRRAQQPDPNVEEVPDFNPFLNVQDSACAYTWNDTALQTVEDLGNQTYIFKKDDELQGDIVWYDTYADAPPLYKQWDVASTIASQQKNSARARINALGFIFNIIVQNINPDFSALGYKLTTKPRAYVYSTGNNTNKEENVDG